MPARILALDVGRAWLRMALVERGVRSRKVLGLYRAARNGGGDLGTEIRALAAAHGLEWDQVVTALPGEDVTHRILSLPFQDRKRLQQVVPFEVESHLPFDLDESVLDYQVLATRDGASVVLAALASKDAVRRHLAAMADAGIDPRAVDLGPLAGLNLLREGAPAATGTIALVIVDQERASVAVLRDATLVGLRTLGRTLADPGGVDGVVGEIAWSVRALLDEAAPAPELWLGGDAADTPGLPDALATALDARPRTLDELTPPSVPPALRGEQAAYTTPLGLALRDRPGAGAAGLDFRRGEFTYHQEREALWRGVTGTGVLALVAILVLVASVLLDGWRLEARRDRVRADIRALFSVALPEARTIVNEKAQLEAAIAALERRRDLYGGLAPSAPRALDVLRAVTLATPEDVDLDVDELSLDGESLQLRGSTRAYEGVDALQRALAERGEFREVEAKDVRASVDGARVAFRLGLTIAEAIGP